MSRSVATKGAYGSVLKGWGIGNIMLFNKEAMRSKIGNMLGNGKDTLMKHKLI